MNRPIRLLYVTYQENILGSGILYTQVIRMLEVMRNYSPETQITLISMLSPQLLFKRWRDFQQLKLRLSDNRIKIYLFPMLFPAVWGWWTPAAMLPWALAVRWIALMRGSNVIHPRGYAAAWLSILAALGLNLPVLFDPRGEYPEEMVLNRRWRKKGVSFHLWKQIESFLIKRCAGGIGVTPDYRDLLKKRGIPRAWFVPNRTDVQRFVGSAEGKEGPKVSQNSEIVLLYIGELDSQWNDPKPILCHYNAIRKVFPVAKLRLVTRADIGRFKSLFEKYKIDFNAIERYSVEPHQMGNVMIGATVGLMFHHPALKLVWRVKLAEYLAAGVPILMDKSFSGLPAEIVIKAGVGFYADPDDTATYSLIFSILKERSEWAKKCVALARRRFDLTSTARQHLRIYRRILNNRSPERRTILHF